MLFKYCGFILWNDKESQVPCMVPYAQSHRAASLTEKQLPQLQRHYLLWTKEATCDEILSLGSQT